MAAEAPRIETPRLLLRPITRDEALVLLGGGRPGSLTYADGYPTEFSREVIDIFVGNRSDEATDFTPFHVIRRQEGDVIGTIGYSTPMGPERPVVGYEIVEPLWGRGYATEALQGLLDHLLSLPSVEAVQADTFETHIASRRVMEKAGMTHIDTREAEVDGERATLVFYEIRQPGQDHEPGPARQ